MLTRARAVSRNHGGRRRAAGAAGGDRAADVGTDTDKDRTGGRPRPSKARLRTQVSGGLCELHRVLMSV